MGIMSIREWFATFRERRDAAAVERALAQSDAEVVFNSAAYNQVDVAEKEPQAAFQVNGLAVRNLALACRQEKCTAEDVFSLRSDLNHQCQSAVNYISARP